MSKKHIGSSFDDFLKEEGLFEEATSHAITRVIAWQLAEAMQAQKISKAEMARRMHTSRAQVQRVLDPENDSVDLDTLQKAAAIVGKRLMAVLVAAVLACGLWTVLPSPELARAAESLSAEACFTPGEDCTERLVRFLDGAQREILVQAYSFTSAPIAKALRDAHKRGVAVTVILDKSLRSERYSSADFLAHAGIPVFIKTGPWIPPSLLGGGKGPAPEAGQIW